MKFVNHVFSNPHHSQPVMKTSFITKNNTQIIQNNNFITLNNNQTIITNFNNILAGRTNMKRSAGSKMGYPKRSNSVMSIHDNSNSFISRENSVHSNHSPHDSKLYFKNLNKDFSRTSDRSQGAYKSRTLNFRHNDGSRQKKQIIPRTNESQKRSLGFQQSEKGPKYSITKGNSRYIQEKKREFSRSTSRNQAKPRSIGRGRQSPNLRSKSPQMKYMGWAMDSQIGGRTNFDYSKPYKSPDLVKHRKLPVGSSYKQNPLQIQAIKFKRSSPVKAGENPLQHQIISLANSKHFEGKKSESLLMKLKENKIEDIDFNNLDLGKKKNLMHTHKLRSQMQPPKTNQTPSNGDFCKRRFFFNL